MAARRGATWLAVDIGHCTANEPVSVGFVDGLGVYVDVSADAHMRRLLYHVRAAAAEANDANIRSLQDRVAVGPEETLAI